MEVQDCFKIYYDGKVNDEYCFRWMIYTGVLLADCKVGDKVVVKDGDNLYSIVTSEGKEYPIVIQAIEQFNKSMQEGTKGLEVGLVFRNSRLPKANGLLIYKA